MHRLALLVGGFLGAILRYQISIMIPTNNGFPLSTLLINIVGCFTLGWFLTFTSIRWRISKEIQIGISTGLIGAFTTFSTFSVENISLLLAHQYGLSAAYICLSIGLGIGFTYVGSKLAQYPNKSKGGAEQG